MTDIIFRTAGPWGSGQGSNLTPVQFDDNNWWFYQHILALEAIETGRGIDYFEVTGSSLFVHLTDHTIQGPFTLPIALFHPRGLWQPSTSYAYLDLVTFRAAVYLVLINHTSASTTFDPSATDGFGNDLYKLLYENPNIPSQGIPTLTWTPTINDANTYNRFTNIHGCTVSVPADLSVSFPIDTELHFRQCTDGPVIIEPQTSDVIIHSVEGYLDITRCRGAVATVKKVATNEWDIFGLLLPGSPHQFGHGHV